MSVYVLSTMTSGVLYRTYKYIGASTQNGSGPLPVPERGGVMIFGGANLPSDRSGLGEMSRDFTGVPIWTAVGVVTTITDEQYEKLKEHWLFKKHEKKGYIKVMNRDVTHNNGEIRRIVENDMKAHDAFALLSKETIKQRIKVKSPDKSLSQDPYDYDKTDPLAAYRG